MEKENRPGIYLETDTGAGISILDGVEAIPIMVNGLEGQFFLEKEETDRRNTITWVDPDSNMQFTVHANLSKDNILHIAESVCLEDSTK